jgi:hypothetical protein
LEKLSVSANDLLVWMSARGQGSWAQFRAAVEELHIAESDNYATAGEEEDSAVLPSFPLHQVLRLNLQRLGHAEFFAGAAGNDWKVTPPALCVTRSEADWLAVVTGARTDSLLRRLYRVTGPFEIETVPLESSPDQIRVGAADLQTLSTIAGQTGMLLQSHAPLSLLTGLPPVDHPDVRRENELPLGSDWKIEQFSTSTLGWKMTTREAALTVKAGLFRFSLAYRIHVLLCLHGRAFQIPAQVGKYYVLHQRRKKIFIYDSPNRRLSLPASCRPPFLVERALILCSGLLPSYQRRPSAIGLLHYAEIPGTVARLAAAVLRQELR